MGADNMPGDGQDQNKPNEPPQDEVASSGATQPKRDARLPGDITEDRHGEPEVSQK